MESLSQQVINAAILVRDAIVLGIVAALIVVSCVALGYELQTKRKI